MMRISLIGMPGGGKSTVGRSLARHLRLPFFDSDSVFEEKFCISIKEFFERQGESDFREAEQDILLELLKKDDMVLATGGGAVLRDTNRILLHEHSTVVYLRSSPEEIYHRLKNDTQRPLLQVANPMDQIKNLYSYRDPLYKSTAHFIVDTGCLSMQDVVRDILIHI